MLRMTLFAKTKSEMDFCDYVVEKRNDGTLPAQIIYSIHRKAIQKERARRFAYFRAALEIVCKREGIRL